VGNLQKGDYTIASFNVTSIEGAGGKIRVPAGDSSTEKVSNAAGNNTIEDNSTSTLKDNSPLKVLIEYTDTKGERIAVTKEVTIQMSTFAEAGKEERPGVRGNNSAMPYLLVLLIAGAGILMFLRRKKGRKKAELASSDEIGSEIRKH